MMRLDDILNEWSEDSEIDKTELGDEALKIAKLHSKYLRYFSQERLALRKYEEDKKILYKLKHDYFRGLLSSEELKEHGWTPFQLSVLKTDVGMHLDADQDWININLKIAVAQEKVDALEQIIKALHNRGFWVKSAIDFEKFKMGA